MCSSGFWKHGLRSTNLLAVGFLWQEESARTGHC